MKEIIYKQVMENIQTPVNLEGRILRSVRRSEPKRRVRPAVVLAPVLAALLIFAVPVVAPYFGGKDIGTGLVVYAGELDLTDPSVADGTLLESFGFFYDNENGITGSPSLFFHVGDRDDKEIESVTFRSHSGTLTSNLEYERMQSGVWNRITIDFQYGDWYKERVNDPENPTDAEIMSILAEMGKDRDLRQELRSQITVDGMIQDSFDFSKLPSVPSEIRVMHKLDPNDGFVFVAFDNPESNVRDFIIDAKELTVIPNEEVRWNLEDFDSIRYAPADTVDFTAYGDTIDVEAKFKDGRIARGVIAIEFNEAGEMFVRYTEDGIRNAEVSDVTGEFTDGQDIQGTTDIISDESGEWVARDAGEVSDDTDAMDVMLTEGQDFQGVTDIISDENGEWFAVPSEDSEN